MKISSILSLGFGLSLLVAGGCKIVVADPCSDGVLDGSESDIDCGGACGVCGQGRRCVGNTDCSTGFCSAGICAVAVAGGTCSDGIQNQTETDVDCGGGCSSCSDGRGCAVNGDCLSGQCGTNNRCASATNVQIPDFSSAPNYICDPGAGLILNPGTVAGYGITSSLNGDGTSNFRVVWTGDAGSSGTYHEFYGSVYTTGTFSALNPGCGGSCALESGDYVSTPYDIVGGQQIDFDTIATTGLDGFDVTVSTDPMYIDAYIDGTHYPNLMVFTSAGAAASAATIPFGVSTH